MDEMLEIKSFANEIIDKYDLKAPFSVFDIAQLEAFNINILNVDDFYSKSRYINKENVGDLIGIYNKKNNTLYINQESNVELQRFCVAHEWGRLLFNKKQANENLIYESDLYNHHNDQKINKANIFASYLLAPDEDINNTLSMYQKFYEGDVLISKLSEVFILNTKLIRKRLALYYLENNKESVTWYQKIFNLTN